MTPVSVLTLREREIVALVADALEDSVIAELLGTKPNTVRRQMAGIRDKIGCYNRVGIAMYAVRSGLVKI